MNPALSLAPVPAALQLGCDLSRRPGREGAATGVLVWRWPEINR